MRKNIFLFCLSLLGLFFTNNIIYASDPAVVSFTANPNYISYGQVTNLSWQLTDAEGAYVNVMCPEGVTVFDDSTNSAFVCNTQVYVGSYLTGTTSNLPLKIINFSGNSKNISIRLTPIGNGGIETGSASKTIVISVGTSPQPILSFTTSKSVRSNEQATLTWTAQDIPGVNFIIGCKNGITITDPTDSTTLPCGSILFKSPKSTSGTAYLKFKNSEYASTSVSLTIVPAISSESYETSHSLISYIEVGPAETIAVPNINSLSASNVSVESGMPITLTWKSSNTEGTNFIVNCGMYVSTAISATSTKNLPCGTIAFEESLPSSGSIDLFFKNNSEYNQSASVSVIPKLTGDTYNSGISKKIDITVRPKKTTNTSPAIITTPTTNIPSSTVNPIVNSQTNFKFTRVMSIGSRGDDVTALQKYFAEDPANYPGTLVTGYYGALTENAVKKFQEKNSIAFSGDPGYGNVGPKTMAKLNGAVNTSVTPATSATPSIPSVPNSTPTSTTVNTTFTRPLEIGSRGDDVTALQQYLAKDPVNYPGVLVTGYFGIITEKALKTFQEIHGLAKPGDQGYGFVGPATRAKLNEIIQKQ